MCYSPVGELADEPAGQHNRRYFNEARPHQGIGQRRPNAFAQAARAATSAPVQSIVARPILDGLHHDYRVAA
jgi:hypothetical protein